MRLNAVKGRSGFGRWREKNELPVVEARTRGGGSGGWLKLVEVPWEGLAGRELGCDPGRLLGRDVGFDPGGDVWSRLSVPMSSESIQLRCASGWSPMSIEGDARAGVLVPEL